MKILYDGLADRHNARGKYIDRCNSAAAQQWQQQWRCAVETFRSIRREPCHICAGTGLTPTD